MGFFFSGTLLRSSAKDELILQYLSNYVIDFNQFKMASEKGKEIFEYVKLAMITASPQTLPQIPLAHPLKA